MKSFIFLSIVAVAHAATPVSDITVPPGFKVELLREAGPREGSWISMALDAEGRIYISPQGSIPESGLAKDSKWGGLWRVTVESKQSAVDSKQSDNGGTPKLPTDNRPLTTPTKWERVPIPVGDSMGMLWAFDSLYVSGNGPEGRGIYRCKDTDGDSLPDTAVMWKKIPGGAGEHGAHALVLSPDKKNIYIVHGNATGLIDGIAPDSPYRNWGEDDLLPKLKDPTATFFDNIKAPYGYVVRTDEAGKKWELIAGGFRNPYDIDFNADGELFTYDSDMEWDRGLPWYRPTRVLHIVPGGEYGFREGSAKMPAYYPDTLPAAVDIGLGCPTGVKFGTLSNFGEKYRRAFFACDWTYGRILAVHMKEKGASYTATNPLKSTTFPKDAESSADVEPFVVGKGMPVTDVEFLKDGSMVFTTGGRGTSAGLYRVSWVGEKQAKLDRIEASKHLAVVIPDPPDTATVIATLKDEIGLAVADSNEAPLLPSLKKALSPRTIDDFPSRLKKPRTGLRTIEVRNANTSPEAKKSPDAVPWNRPEKWEGQGPFEGLTPGETPAKTPQAGAPVPLPGTVIQLEDGTKIRNGETQTTENSVEALRLGGNSKLPVAFTSFPERLFDRPREQREFFHLTLQRNLCDWLVATEIPRGWSDSIQSAVERDPFSAFAAALDAECRDGDQLLQKFPERTSLDEAKRVNAANKSYQRIALLYTLGSARGRDAKPEAIFEFLKAFPLKDLPDDLKLIKLRILQLTFARHGRPSEEWQKVGLEKLLASYPAKGERAADLNRELSQLLVWLSQPELGDMNPAASEKKGAPAPSGAAPIPSGVAPPADGAAPKSSGVTPPARGAAPISSVDALPARGGAPISSVDTRPARGDAPISSEDTPPARGDAPISSVDAPPARGDAPISSRDALPTAMDAPGSCEGALLAVGDVPVPSGDPVGNGKSGVAAGSGGTPAADSVPKPETNTSRDKTAVGDKSVAAPIANPGAAVHSGRKGAAFHAELGQQVIEKTLALMDAAPSQEEQISYALVLRWAHGWTPQQRERYFRWFHEKAVRFPGGNSMQGFIRKIHTEAASRVPDSEKVALAKWLIPLTGPAPELISPRAAIKQWTLAGLEKELDALKDYKPDVARGKAFFAEAQCSRCHLFKDTGGNVGPDLSAVAQRFQRHDILEAITDPNKVVSDQYALTTLTVIKFGGGEEQVTGLLQEETSGTIRILTDPLTGASREFYHNVVKKKEKAPVSLMPPGLLNIMTAEEVADLLAYLGR